MNAANSTFLMGQISSETKLERWSVAKRLNNASGQWLCLSILPSLYIHAIHAIYAAIYQIDEYLACFIHTANAELQIQ